MEESMAFQATLDDWLSLLGVEAQFNEVHDGRREIAVMLADLDAARTSWPDVAQDYVGILDATREIVLELRPIIAQQATYLADLRRSVDDINALQDYIFVQQPPATPTDRLLNSTELDAITKVLDKIDEAVGAIQNAPEDEGEDSEEFAGDKNLDAGDENLDAEDDNVNDG
jgi:hypothetical protein